MTTNDHWLPGAGHNLPPTPQDQIRSVYAPWLGEAEGWLDGQRVENDGQMQAVDAILAKVKEAIRAAEDGKEAEFRPLKKAADDCSARWAPLLLDTNNIKRGLVALVDGFKRKRAEELAAERRAAEAEARRLAEEASRAMATADIANLEERRQADNLAAMAREAERAAQAVPEVKGLRTFTLVEVTDPQALARYIWANDRPAMQAFLNEYAEKHTGDLPGVTRRKEKRAI